MPDELISADNPLAALLGAGDDCNLEAQEATSYVGFYSQKSAKALEIAQGVPGISEGEAYLCDGGNFFPVDSIIFAGPVFKYFAEKDDDGKILRASLKGDWDDKDLKEAVIALVFAVSGDRLVRP